MDSDKDALRLKLALSFTPGMTAAMAELIGESGISWKQFTTMSSAELSGICQGNIADKVKRQEADFRACKELEFIERHHVKAHFISDESYPFLLRQISDPPIVLYQLGDTDLNAERLISVVGTRRITPYGAKQCQKIVEESAVLFPDAIIVSGLAYGTDTIAHQTALSSGMITVGVVAHGLDTLYPAQNRDLARRMIKEGGSILSEYPSGTTPFQRRFLERNRIVAGLAQLTLIIESPIRGGAMSTANSAFNYSREVMALPGRVGDEMSEGCNMLIRREKAHLISGAADIVESMGWTPKALQPEAVQRDLFPEMSDLGKKIHGALKSQNEPLSLDALYGLTRIPVAQLMSALTDMEFDGIVIRHPGNRFSVS